MPNPKSVAAVNPAKKTSCVTGPMGDDATVLTANKDVKCYWNDEEFQNGDRVATDGKTYEASNGQWVEV